MVGVCVSGSDCVAEKEGMEARGEVRESPSDIEAGCSVCLNKEGSESRESC